MKVRKWSGIEDLKQYEVFSNTWHYIIKGLGEKLIGIDAKQCKQVQLTILQIFFMKEYSFESDFYSQFQQRMELIKDSGLLESFES